MDSGLERRRRTGHIAFGILVPLSVQTRPGRGVCRVVPATAAGSQPGQGSCVYSSPGEFSSHITCRG